LQVIYVYETDSRPVTNKLTRICHYCYLNGIDQNYVPYTQDKSSKSVVVMNDWSYRENFRKK